MKADTHPTYFPEAKVVCACGNAFTTGATVKELSVELCSACHPFYTGKQKLVDTSRRVEKFQERTSKKPSSDTKATGKKARTAKRVAQKAAKASK
ncbi:MAG: 50S ribosomal protein L31 [Patescibacteria group bacterium]|nr:MAG: 50S ribosomal protein L31 [Patescibacteria group bacterium]